MKTILVTGASGFVGQAVCGQLSPNYHVIGLDTHPGMDSRKKVTFVRADITDQETVRSTLMHYRPDAVIHCAGISHQKIISRAGEYDRVNNRAAISLAREAFLANPRVHFIFLSSISVYGQSHGPAAVKESEACRPNSGYARSKLRAEENLTRLFDRFQLNRLDIFRLAPVYDVSWSRNLEKRVFAPKKIAYVQFGSGNQKVSVLARKNLVDFIVFRLKNNPGDRFFNILNICDQSPSSFNEIIRVFQSSRCQPDRWRVKIPLVFVRMAVRLAGKLFKQRSDWIDSYYDKLEKDSVFDTGRMLESGFLPTQTLRSVYMGETGKKLL